MSDEEISLQDRDFLAAIVDSSNDAILSKTLDGIITSWNKGAEAIYGYKAEEVVGQNVSILVPESNRDEIPKILERLRKGEMIRHYETVRLRKDGSTIDVTITISPIRDEKGKIIAVSSIAKDITDKKLTEKQIAAQLAEKEILLKEIYHRVKNNLQLVSSLLELRARNVADIEGRNAFKDSIGRIRAMALVHEKIYKSENLGSVDLADYINALLEPLIRSYSEVQKPVKFSIRSDSCWLDLNRAIPLGLILNELLTNSLKHAFDSIQECQIKIHIDAHSDSINLTLSDNGVGLPKDIDLFTSDTFGFKIVRLLMEQINSTIEIHTDRGTTFKIQIPRERMEQQA